MKVLPYIIILALLGVVLLQHDRLQKGGGPLGGTGAAGPGTAGPAVSTVSAPGALGLYQQALAGLAQGKEVEALATLTGLLESYPKDPLVPHARLHHDFLKGRVSNKKVERKRKREKQDLEQILALAPGEALPEAPDEENEAVVPLVGCGALEENPDTFSGKRLRVTDTIKRIDSDLSFADCTMVTISTERLSEKRLKALVARFKGKERRRLALSGRFEGLTFYLESP